MNDTPTTTVREQRAVEESISALYLHTFENTHNFNRLKLQRNKHVRYLRKGLEYLPGSFTSLDASRPWLCYWILHGLTLLGESVEEQTAQRCIETLNRCQHKSGGYGGGPGQMPHLATTYAAVCALITIGGPAALESIDRQAMLTFLLQMKCPDGSFRVHEDGEIDVRGCYTAMAVAHLLNIKDHRLFSNVGKFIKSCQTYEGGMSGIPGMEAHGGYTFCGLAAAMLSGQEDELDLPALLDWAVSRQGNMEGGFQGRTNKLVDGCYSFWQGALFCLIKKIESKVGAQLQLSGTEVKVESGVLGSHGQQEEGRGSNPAEGSKEGDHTHSDPLLFNTHALQGYILICCQAEEGGLIDKPGKSRDYYHTCYCLSGLSCAQHGSLPLNSPPGARDVIGLNSNLLLRTEPTVNLSVARYSEAMAHFSSLELL